MLATLLVLSATATAGHRADPGETLTFDPAATYRVPRGVSPSEGPVEAPVTIVVWSDYRCEYCNRVQGTLDSLQRLFPGQIRLVHRALPLDEDDTVGIEAALAASAQGAFRPMHDRLFGLYGHIDRPSVEMIARELGLDMARFRAELDAGTYKQAIVDDVTDAAALGITGSPMFFVNGRPVNGNQPLAVFVDMVDAGLVRAAEVGKTHPDDLYQAMVANGSRVADAGKEAKHAAPPLDPSQVYRMGLGLPGHQLGPDDAPVTLIEWSDFACPYCAKEAPTIAHIHEKYGDQVKIVYRHFPLHRTSDLAAEAAVAAAAQGKFWPYHDQLWAQFGRLGRPDLEDAAQAVGLDMTKFRAALDNRTYHDVVAAESADASAGSFGGTPTSFLDGHPIIGAIKAEGMDRLIDSELARAKAAIAAGVAPRDLYAIEMSGSIGSERADPATLPQASALHLEPTALDRERSIVAACRRRDDRAARALVANMTAESQRRVTAVCATSGVDLALQQ